MRNYCGRTLAVFLSLNHSFYKVFKSLVKYGFDKNDAYTITYRTKRGLVKTENKGAFTKDYIYLSGYKKVNDFITSESDFQDLVRYGKISIEHLKTMREVFPN